MRIAQVSPLYESVPPKYYGGTERVVSYLTEELVRQGHDVTLFASGDSVTRARLVPVCEHALRLDRSCQDQLAHHVRLVDMVCEHTRNVDLVHYHIDYLHYPVSKRRRVPHATTLHGRLDLPDLAALYRHFRRMPVISISDAQRQPLPWLNWQATVYHGLPEDGYQFREGSGQYLAFLGRISPEKSPDRAIEIAKRAGLPLRIAAKVDARDRDYFEQKIRPLLNHPRVDFIGEIGERDKNEFLGEAMALLLPIDWPEPFGLVVIEALACGTPVVAWPRGSLPELIEDGATGFLVDSVEAAAEAAGRCLSLNRHRCRQAFEQRFTAARMATDYVKVYQRLAAAQAMQTLAA